jgi:hypothetical protein
MGQMATPKLAPLTLPTTMAHQASLNSGFMAMHSIRPPPKAMVSPRAQMPGKNPGVKDIGGGKY